MGQFNNPYLQGQGQMQGSPYGFVNAQNNPLNLPRYEILKVNGKNGAEALQMGPNSSVLLLDETNPIVWLAQTDSAGYKTLTPYSISLYEPEPPVDVKALEQRITTLETLLERMVNNESNSSGNGLTKDERNNKSAQRNAGKN